MVTEKSTIEFLKSIPSFTVYSVTQHCENCLENKSVEYAVVTDIGTPFYLCDDCYLLLGNGIEIPLRKERCNE